MKVTAQTILRWVAEYRQGGLDALRPKPKRPRPSKLDAAQKAAVIAWLEGGRTAAGEHVHWTLGRLSAAVREEFGVGISGNALWVWLRKEGWRQLAPRPRRHQADAAAQGDFKKNAGDSGRRPRRGRVLLRRGPPSAGGGRGAAGARWRL